IQPAAAAATCPGIQTAMCDWCRTRQPTKGVKYERDAGKAGRGSSGGQGEALPQPGRRRPGPGAQPRGAAPGGGDSGSAGRGADAGAGGQRPERLGAALLPGGGAGLAWSGGCLRPAAARTGTQRRARSGEAAPPAGAARARVDPAADAGAAGAAEHRPGAAASAGQGRHQEAAASAEGAGAAGGRPFTNRSGAGRGGGRGSISSRGGTVARTQPVPRACRLASRGCPDFSGMEDTNMRGRYPSGPEYVEQLPGSAEAKRRLQVVLQTMSGAYRVQEACTLLGISRQRFEQLRTKVLRAALTELEPKPGGRPPAEPSVGAAVTALETKLAETERELRAARLREQIALVLPRAAQPLADPGQPDGAEKRNGP